MHVSPQQVKYGYWKNVENHKKLFESIAINFGIENAKDWGKLSTQNIIKFPGGKSVLKIFQGSFHKALRSTYKGNYNCFVSNFSDIPWDAILLQHRTKSYWDQKENQRKYLEEFAKKHNIKSPLDWSFVTVEQIKKSQGNSLLDRYGGSLVKALRAVFPGFH